MFEGRAEPVLTLEELVETGSSFTDEKLRLRPRIGDYEITVQLDPKPSVGRGSLYRALDGHGLENPFFVFRGPPPLTSLVLELKSAEVDVLEISADARSRLDARCPEGDEVEEVLAIRYVIGWNEHRLEGRAHILRTTHRESGYLLD